MKIKLIFVAALIFCMTGIKAQETANKQGCDFLKDLHFTSGVDTIIVLAYKDANVKLPPYDDNLRKLNNEKKLNKADFNYDVSFTPLNCSEMFVAACKDKSDFATKINGSNYHKVVKIRCIVFEDMFELSHPYFVIDKITPEN